MIRYKKSSVTSVELVHHKPSTRPVQFSIVFHQHYQKLHSTHDHHVGKDQDAPFGHVCDADLIVTRAGVGFIGENPHLDGF